MRIRCLGHSWDSSRVLHVADSVSANWIGSKRVGRIIEWVVIAEKHPGLAARPHPMSTAFADKSRKLHNRITSWNLTLHHDDIHFIRRRAGEWLLIASGKYLQVKIVKNWWHVKRWQTPKILVVVVVLFTFFIIFYFLPGKFCCFSLSPVRKISLTYFRVALSSFVVDIFFLFTFPIEFFISSWSSFSSGGEIGYVSGKSARNVFGSLQQFDFVDTTFPRCLTSYRFWLAYPKDERKKIMSSGKALWYYDGNWKEIHVPNCNIYETLSQSSLEPAFHQFAFSLRCLLWLSMFIIWENDPLPAFFFPFASGASGSRRRVSHRIIFHLFCSLFFSRW